MNQKCPLKRVVLVAISANIAYFAFGTCLGWTSPILPKLKYQTYDSPLSIGLTKSQEGWIGSNISIGALISSLAAGQIDYRFGKKLTIFFSVALITVSYICLLFATQVWMLFVARFIQGIAGGVLTASVPMYIGEIATDDIRGALGSLSSIFNAGGVLCVYCIGPYVSYITMQWFCLATPMFFFVTFVFMPETPYYLAQNGRKMELLKTLELLRGYSGKAIEDEMNEILASAETDKQRKGSYLDIFRDKGYVKALVICCGLLAFQQFNGSTAVTFNSQSIFDSANSIVLDPSVSTIILGVIRLISSLFTPLVVEIIGRKIILLISALGMSLSLFVLGIFFYAQETSADVLQNVMWIPVPTLIIFNISYSFGFGPVPWAILGEMFPPNLKTMAACLASTTSWMSTFLMTRWFPELNALGAYYAFFIFGTLIASSIFFIIFYVIETKGLSMENIRKKLLL